MRRSGKREEILHFIQEFISQRGYSPTVREICDATGLKSTASAYYHLQALAQDGSILIDESKKRAISLPESQQPGMIPVVGVVAAGQPILAIEHIEGYIHWDADPDCFALRVRGQSMIGAGILPGDKVVVRPQPTADEGDIVVAMIDDEATVKRLSFRDGVWLLPENPDYAPIDGRFATILGKVKGVVREYR